MNTVHVHLLFTHVPVLLTVFGLGLLVFAIVRGNYTLKKTALTCFVLSGLFAVGVYLTGEPAEHSVEKIPGISKAIIERHEDAAGGALTSALALATFSALGAFLYRKSRPMPNWFVASALVVSIITAGFMAWTANLGGQVRHTEIRGPAGSAQLEVKGDL